MKQLALFFLCSMTALAGDFLTGQAARITFGQSTFTSQDIGNPSQYQVGGVSGLAYVNNTLFVVDSNHIQATPVDNRVLIYGDTSQYVYPPTAEIPQGSRCPVCVSHPDVGGATLVLGQPDFVTTSQNTAGPTYAITGATNASPIVLTMANTSGLSVGETVSVAGVTGNTGANGVWTIQALTSTQVTLSGSQGNAAYTGGGTLALTAVGPLGMRSPTGVASNGQILAVTDTDNNRILIWNSIPTTIDQPPDLVLGQPNFTTVQEPPPLNASSLRGPEGVWIQGTQLFVADTQNDRILIWNSIPTSNNQAADLVLGEPNFTTAPAATVSDLPPTSNNLFSPVAVTSDGTRLFVTDLGHNRVLIWNSIPTQNQQAADVVIGQPDMTHEASNYVLGTCVSNGTDSDSNPTYPSGCTTFCPNNGIDTDNNPTYPLRCGLTLSYPRYALSDGQRLYIADGGNDRVLVYDSIPIQNAAQADIILGQVDQYQDQVTDNTDTFRPDANIERSAPNEIRSPLGLAWDGTNLYVSDPFNRRVVVYTPNSPNIPVTGITNAASLNTYALGTVILSDTGTITANDTVTITINGTNYTYTVVSSDTLATITQNIVNLINAAPDPNVIAIANVGFYEIILTSRTPGLNGNNITYSATTAGVNTATAPTETATAGGANLTGGAAAAELAPGSLVTITGTDLADTTASATPSGGYYPTSFNGVQVYFDGIQSPVIYVSPTQINAQLPFEVQDANGVSAVVRTVHNDGTVTATNAISVPVVFENPGIFAMPGNDPRPVLAYHTESNAIAAVSIDGTVTGGNILTITINGNAYSYTVQATDTLATVRDAFVVLINDNPNEAVVASAAGEYTRLILTAKVAGPAGNGITITLTTNSGATVTLTNLGSGQTCCANIAGSRVTPDNPAVPGEVITIYATGLGPATLLDGSGPVGITGQVYEGPVPNTPAAPVDNAQIGGSTANVLAAGLEPGMIGVYRVDLQLNSTLPTNPNTQMYIAQNVFTSNIVTIPVVSPVPPSSTSSAVNARKGNARAADQRRR